MTPAGRLQVGDTITTMPDRTPFIVIAVGRSSCYSIVVADQEHRMHLFSEVPFYLDNKRMVFRSHKKQNVKWARQFRTAHADEVVDV